MGDSGRPQKLRAVHSSEHAAGAAAAESASDATLVDLLIVWHAPEHRLHEALRELAVGAVCRRWARPAQGLSIHVSDVDVMQARDWMHRHAGEAEIVSPRWLQEWLADDWARQARGMEASPIEDDAGSSGVLGERTAAVADPARVAEGSSPAPSKED